MSVGYKPGAALAALLASAAAGVLIQTAAVAQARPGGWYRDGKGGKETG